jgi:hypothetical protein
MFGHASKSVEYTDGFEDGSKKKEKKINMGC